MIAQAGFAFTEERGEAMGTPCRVSICHRVDHRAQACAAAAAAMAVLHDVDRRLSVYRPDSALSRWNRGLDVLSGAAPLLKRLVRRAERLKHLTGGAFDAGVRGKLDLGAIAKGTAVDLAGSAIRARGFHDFLVDAGGDLYAAGQHGIDRWTIVVPQPDVPSALVALSVSDLAVATSGGESRGDHVSRTVTSDGLQSCVVGPRAELADALATAVLAAGSAAAGFMRRFPRYGFLLLDASDMIHMDATFETLVRPLGVAHAELL